MKSFGLGRGSLLVTAIAVLMAVLVMLTGLVSIVAGTIFHA
jgi:hypothetical protein